MRIKVVFLVILSIVLSKQSSLCKLCHILVNLVQHGAPAKSIENVLSAIGTQYCTKKHLQDQTVCHGAVKQMLHPIVNSVWRHYIDPHALCHKVKLCSQQYFQRDLQQDIDKILKGKPQKQWQTPTQRKILKIIHISDLHPDLFYAVGANWNCSEPVCCRANVTNRRNGFLESDVYSATPASYWGSIAKCDLPMQTFDLFLSELQKIDVDLIIWTGDNTPHDIWAQSQSYNLNFTSILTEKIKRHTKAVVIAAMGNHQSFPVNVYDYEGKRQAMLNAGLAEAWRKWLTPQAYTMLRTKGYYSIVLPQFNNLKIISVNTQAQNDMNWFLLRDPTDPGGMLKWIEQELKQSEQKSQFVYIIGHISPKSALNAWSMRFNALTDRYSYTIRGQFYGHTHDDHLGFFTSLSHRDQLSGYFLIAPSLTTYSGKHPEYRIMSADYDTLQTLDYDQYLLNITKYTRKQENAQFQLFYNFRKAYNVSNMMTQKGMTEVYQLIKTSAEAQIKYTYLRSSGIQAGKAGKDVICDTTTSPQFQTACRNSTYKESKFQQFAGPWKDLVHK